MVFLWPFVPSKRHILAVCAGLAYGIAEAQPICSIDLGPDHTICQGQTVQLNAPGGFPSYLWSNGGTGQSITVGASGNYWCQASYPVANLVTNGNFNSGNSGFSSEFIYDPNLNVDGNFIIGTNAASYHPQFSGTGNGNFMIVNSGWPVALRRVWCQTVTVCPGQTYTLSYRARTVSNNTPARLQWWIDGVAVGPEANLPAFVSGWQTITQTWTTGGAQTSANICLRVMSGEGIGNDFGLDDISLTGTIVLTDFVQVNVTPLPIVNLGPNATLCEGQSLVLDAGVPGGTYLWQDGSTGDSFVVTGLGNYSVTVTANNCSASDAILVNYDPLPTVDLGPDLTLCAGQTVTLNATVPGATYMWQDASTGPTLTVSSAGTYAVTVTLNGCSFSDVVDVGYTPLPVVDLGPDLTLCDGETVTLDATTPGATYLWLDGSTAATQTVTSLGTYGVQVTVNNCSAIDLVNVAYNPIPFVDLGPDRTVCPGTGVILDATMPGATYLWQDGSMGPSFNATTPGTYTVEVTLNNCSYTESVDIAHFTLQTVDLGPDLQICEGDVVTLSVNEPGATYLWSTGAITDAINVSATGTYWVEVTLNGCTVTDVVDVIMDPMPVVDLGPDQGVCAGDQVTLDATTAGATYDWSTGAATPTIAVGPGNYTVDVTVNGCTTTDAITVNALPSPTVDLGPDAILCVGEILVVDAFQPGATYLWHDGSTGPTFTLITPGFASVTVTDANGCTGLDAISLTHVTPVPVELGADITICPGDQAVISAPNIPGASYLWSTGAVVPGIIVSTTGTYSVTVTQGPCTVTDQVTVTVAPPPTVDLGPDLTICPGGNVELDATTPGATDYLWSTGETTPTITVSTTNIFSVTVTNGAECTATDDATVTTLVLGSVELGPDITLCAGGGTTLDATVPGATYLWNTGATTSTLNVTTAGNYSVQVSQSGCTVTDDIDVAVLPAIPLELGNGITLCAGDNTVLDATVAGATYLWNTGATTPTITVSTTGNYSVAVTLIGCTVNDAVTVTVLSATSVELGPDQSLCQGQTTVLDATTPGATYLWSTGAITPTITVGSTGNYSVTVSQSGCSVSDDVDVTVNPMPTVDLGADVTLCEGEDIVLDATYPGATYLWSNGATTPTITVNTTGNHSVTVDLNGCTATDAIIITVLTATALELGPDQTFCQGQTTVLDATTPGATYLWSTGAITPTIAVGSTGNYSVTVSQSGCSVSDDVDVTVNPMPTVDLGVDVTLCEGDDIVLDATYPGATYLWSNGATTPTITVSTTGSYSVTVDLSGCTATDAITITVLTASALELGPDQTFCQGQITVLDATTPGATYLWSTGAITPTITVGSTGNYSVTVSQSGCSVSDDVDVTVNPMPTVDLGADVTLCEGEDIVLDATYAGATYQWSNGATTPTITVSTTGNYSVTVDLNGCTAADAITITVLTATSLDLGPDQTFCQGGTTVLDATTPGATYLWSTGAITPTITVGSTGNYSVTVSQSGCSVSDDVDVTVNPMPTVDLGADVTLCEGEDIVLDATYPGATYLWNTGATTPTITVNATGNYSVTVDLGGCTATDAITVTVLTATSLDLGPDQTFCEGQSTVLDATTPGATYLWSTGAITPAITVDATGNYSVTVSQSGCSVSDDVDVTVNPAPTVELGADQVLCNGETSLLLDATVPGATYLWNTGATTPVITATTSGTYSVDVDLNGCVTTDAVTVTFGSLVVSLGNDTLLCPGQTLTLEVDMTGLLINWNDAPGGSSLVVSTPGTYWVLLTSMNGCTATDTIVVDYAAPGSLDLGPDITACEGETVTLDATFPGALLLWENGSTAPVRNVTTSGTYSVTAAVGSCEVSDAIEVTFLPPPTVDIGPDAEICPDASALFDATTPNATYLWHDGSTAATYQSFTEETVSVEVTVSGCSTDDQAAVTLLEGPVADLGNDTTICEGQTLVLNVTQPGGTYLWDDNSSAPTRMVNEPGTYAVQVWRNGCLAADAVTVEVFSPDVVDLGGDAVLCPGNSVTLTATVPGATYLWSTGATSSSIVANTTGTYWVEVYVASCIARDTMDVRVVPLVAPQLGPDVIACADEVVTLSVVPGAASVLWSTGSTNDSLVVSTNGTYSVQLELEGCTASDVIQVTLWERVDTLDLGPERTICPGQEVLLAPQTVPGGSYHWSTGHSGQFLTVTNAGTYTVHVEGPCADADGVVTIIEGDCSPSIFVPNSFTPNGDDINEFFNPVIDGTVERYRLDIFDRWGERIFTTEDRGEGWDGTLNGTPVQDGVYVWTITYKAVTDEGVKQDRLIGHVTLLR